MTTKIRTVDNLFAIRYTLSGLFRRRQQVHFMHKGLLPPAEVGVQMFI